MVTSMLSLHLRKFSDLYAAYGLGAVKNIWLITCLIPLARTANLNKMKDYGMLYAALFYIPNNTTSLSSTTWVSRRMRCSQGSTSEDFFSNRTR